MTDYEQWERRIQEEKVTMFLALEDNQGAHRYLVIENATEQEAIDFTDDAFKYTQYRAVFLYDAYCPECHTAGFLVDCNHQLIPATQYDFVHCRIDVDEVKEGVEKHD